YDLAGNTLSFLEGRRSFARKPSSLTFESAAALPVVGLTSLQAVRDCASLPLPVTKPGADSSGKGESTSTSRSDSSRCSARFLVANMSGGVGHLAVQLAKAAGAQVSSSANPPISGQYYVVIDCSPTSLAVSAVGRVLRPQGRWAHVELPLSLLALGLWRRLALRPRKLHPAMMANREGDLEVLGRMAEEGKVRVVVESTVAFEEAREAWRRSMGGHVTGKVVVRRME
ncbi:unnamed protein product, partial [Closterium sp. Naga37s-1]